MAGLFWSGGRLVGLSEDNWVSLSIDEAWPLTVKDDRIAEACENVLKLYSKHNIHVINSLLREERQREKILK